jgi:alkyldihydroxyacetonephosphate synthase
MVDDLRLWGWLGPDHPDALAGSQLAQAYVMRCLGLSRLEDTPPVALDASCVPASRLTETQRAMLQAAIGADHVATDVPTRARAALGQSYPDQLERRAGRFGRVPDAVVLPGSADEAVALLALAAHHGLAVTPRGGGTSVVGGLRAAGDSRPWVVADLARLNRVVSVSAIDRTAVVQAGMTLPALEDALRPQGLTLGHFPQSFHGVTLGGAVAASGSGQRSDRYGRVSDNLVSARIATPQGLWASEANRHASAGPWLGGLAAGSEGLFGILTDVTVRLHHVPEHVEDRAYMFPSFAAASDAVRTLAQDGHGLAMLRVSDEAETGFLGGFRLARAGLERASFIERTVLALKRVPEQPALLLAGYEGSASGVGPAFRSASGVLRRHGAIGLGARPGASWRRGRFDTPHLRETLMARGIGVDTYETVAPWSRLPELHRTVTEAITAAAAATIGAGQGKPAVFCHLSHSYPDAACLYFTALFPRAADPYTQWLAIKRATTDAIVAGGGALSHHHGLGADHAAWAEGDKGELGIALLGAMSRTLDPGGVMAVGASAGLKR